MSTLRAVSTIDDRVVVVAWNAQWPALARAEATRLAALVSVVEHVGSTAVPGMPSRPVLDLAAGVDSLTGHGEAVAAAFVATLGFERRGTEGESIRLHRAGDPAIEVRVLESGGPLWRDAIAFRDYLRAHPDEASLYARTKRRAAEGGPTTAVYEERKRETLEMLQLRARRWKASHPRG